MPLFLVLADPQSRRALFVQPDRGTPAPTEIFCASLDGKRIFSPSQLIVARIPELPAGVHSLNCARYFLSEDGQCLLPGSAVAWPNRPGGVWQTALGVSAESISEPQWPIAPVKTDAVEEEPQASGALSLSPSLSAAVAATSEEPDLGAGGLSPFPDAPFLAARLATDEEAVSPARSIASPPEQPAGLWFLPLYLRQAQCMAFRASPESEQHPIIAAQARALGVSEQEAALATEQELRAVFDPLAAAEETRETELRPFAENPPEPTPCFSRGKESLDHTDAQAWLASMHLMRAHCLAAWQAEGEGFGAISAQPFFIVAARAAVRSIPIAQSAREIWESLDRAEAPILAAERLREQQGLAPFFPPIGVDSAQEMSAETLSKCGAAWFCALQLRLADAGRALKAGSDELSGAQSAPLSADRAKIRNLPLCAAAESIIEEIGGFFETVSEREVRQFAPFAWSLDAQ